MIKSK